MTEEKSIRQILIEKDEVTLVDSNRAFIAPEDKYEAHKYPSKLHLAISVWLFNSKGQILFQQRSSKKIVGAGWWANTVCGNVWTTETYFDCANRRLKHELGIVEATIKPVYKFSYKAYGNETYGEHEIDQVYVGLFEDNLTGSASAISSSSTVLSNSTIFPNPDEVSDILWVDFKELFSKIALLEYVSEEESLLLDHKNLKEKTQPVKITISGKELLIAPWTIMMLKKSKLFDEYKEILAR